MHASEPALLCAALWILHSLLSIVLLSMTHAEIKAVRRRIERDRDMEGIDTTNILDEPRGRRTRAVSRPSYTDADDEDEEGDEEGGEGGDGPGEGAGEGDGGEDEDDKEGEEEDEDDEEDEEVDEDDEEDYEDEDDDE